MEGLKDFLPEKAYFIEPFYGEGHLAETLNINFNEYYDIIGEGEHQRDTLKNPPNYEGKWVITNPPYLAKNKAKDKMLFKMYPYDDLYKIAVATILKAEGGLLIIPINFFTDEKSFQIRNNFFNNFEIMRLNIYLDSMFDNTDYNVCSFVFKRKDNDCDKEHINTFIYKDQKENNNFSLELNKKYNYRIGGDFFYSIKKNKNLFNRITISKPNNPTHINIVCIDKTQEPLHFYYQEEPYYGKDSDRNIATLSFNGELTEEMEKSLIEEANKIISDFRKKTYNLCFTNYRDRHRKRIGFTEAYQIMTLAYNNLYK